MLVISYNITLWHFVKDMIARSPFPFRWDSFVFNHFHGFCSDILNEHGDKWPVSPQREKFSSREEFENAIELFFKLKFNTTLPLHNKIMFAQIFDLFSIIILVFI